jgi:hypothetical protein
MTMPIRTPALSSSPFRLAERAMEASPDVLFRAWTKQMDYCLRPLGLT